jgi:hypothetical protein
MTTHNTRKKKLRKAKREKLKKLKSRRKKLILHNNMSNVSTLEPILGNNLILKHAEELQICAEIIESQYKSAEGVIGFRLTNNPAMEENFLPQIDMSDPEVRKRARFRMNANLEIQKLDKYIGGFTISLFNSHENAEKSLNIHRNRLIEKGKEKEAEGFTKRLGLESVKVQLRAEDGLVSEPDSTGHFGLLPSKSFNFRQVIIKESYKKVKLDE